MRVALLTYSTKPRGGVVHTLALAEALARHGATVTVFSLGRGGDASFFRPVDEAVQVALVPFPEVAGESVGQRVLRSVALLGEAFAARAGEFDIVHAQDCISANAALLSGRPVIRTVHHLDHFTTPELVACHERALVKPAAHVCVSAAVATELAVDWGLTPTVIANGVDAARFSEAAADTTGRDAWRAELAELGVKQPFVLAVGGIEPRKGTDVLVEAMGLVQKRRSGTRLVLAGGDTLFDYREFRAAVETQAAALGVEPVILGPVAHDRLPSLMALAGVFAFPSRAEGFGLSPLEALAAGTPVVASDLPVLREVLESAVRYADGPVDLATKLGDALVTAYAPDAGRIRAFQFSWAEAAAAHLTLYRSMTAHQTESPA